MSSSEPYLKDLSFRGYIEGLTYLSATTVEEQKKVDCHYFGGIPYALPPVGPYRWRLPRPLPPCHRYGTRANPGRFTGNAGLCPQPGHMRPATPELWDEDCLQLNIWIPAGEPPQPTETRTSGGWPVLFFIHGGWLQFGSPGTINARAMLGESANQCIIVCPAYRLNVFGFLACEELQAESRLYAAHGSRAPPVGNYGFWDQRLALEWTWKNISYFGGDAANITIAGYSAGAHSVFQQLSHELFLEPSTRIIRRAVMFSNGCAMPAKPVAELQPQFEALLQALTIPLTLSGAERIQRLRAVPAADLVSAAEKLELHEFRAAADGGAFIALQLYAALESGEYAARLRAAGIELVMGECSEENFMYGSWRSDGVTSLETLRRRLCADYPRAAVDALLAKHYCPGGRLPEFKGARCATWADAFGHIYADLQVYALERALVDRLARAGAGELLHRYRVEWRVGAADAVYPDGWGVTHSTDLAIWFWGNTLPGGLAARKGDRDVVRSFVQPYVDFLGGRGFGAASGPRQMHRLKPDGSLDVWQDEHYDKGLAVWEIVLDALGVPTRGGSSITTTGTSVISSKL